MTTDTTERGLERLICAALTGAPCDPGVPQNAVQLRPAPYCGGWICARPEDYDREYCVDLVQLSAFLRETQPEVGALLELDQDGPTRRKFLARLQGEISKRGTIDVLRHGLKHGPHITLISSTARLRRTTQRPTNATPPTVSASRGSSATAATRRSGRSIWACSSTVCRSRPSS